MTTPPMFGLFFTDSTVAPSKFVTENLVSTSHSIEKLKDSVPHIELWNVCKPTAKKSMLFYNESGSNQKYHIREVPHIV